MGTTISIDKHVSNLDELLEMQPSYFSTIQFENTIPEGVTQHLKIWKFYEDHKKVDMIKTLPVPLATLQNSEFMFSSEEAYLILLIYKSDAEENCELVNFPHSLCGIVESVSNLTPRGLLSTFSSTNESVNEPPVNSAKFVENLESLLLSKRQQKDTKYKYMLFLWNGKNSSSLVKALAITKGYELDALLYSSKDPLLNILFSGGVIRHKKLQRGSVLLFSDMISSASPKEEPAASSKIGTIKKACETVYLLQWWLPQHGKKAEKTDSEKQTLKYPRFTHTMLTCAPKEKTDYFSRFEEIEEDEEIEKENLAGKIIENQENSVKSIEEKAEVLPTLDKPKKFEMPKLSFAMKKNQPDEDQKMQIAKENPIMEKEQSEPMEENLEIEDKIKESPKENKNEAQKVKGIGLPMGLLKTREEEAQELRKNVTAVVENVGIRDTNRREIQNELYSNQCSEIIKDFLYMGSDNIAQDKELLKSFKITHIVNCAADYCDCYFPDEFKYKSYYLKDSVQECIECCFYDTIDFIKSAEISGGRVFVHCIQGVSRSATLCLAYLIFAKQMPHKSAFEIIQKVRPIANPNMIFNIQLIWWHMRLFQEYSALPVSPRVYAISSHQKEQPTYIVARLVFLRKCKEKYS